MASLILTRVRDKTWRLLLGGMLLALAAGNPVNSWADSQDSATPSKQDIEAAYLYKFGEYVTWPNQAFAAPDSPVVIGVADADELATTLETLTAGRTINNRAVVIRPIHSSRSLAGVHILFVGHPKSTLARELFAAAHGLPVLVVTDGEQGLDMGSAITFVVIADRVRFNVSLDTVQESGLKLSALLLSVAHSVSGTPQ